MTIFTVPTLGGAAGPPGPPGPVGPSGPTGAAGPTGDNTVFLRYSSDVGVPSGGLQYFRLAAGVFASEAGDLSTADATIRGVSVNVDSVDVSRAYDVEVLTDPSGAGGTGPTLVATLSLATNTLRARSSSYVVAVSGLLDIGVRMRRTSGSGASTFQEAVVIVEVSLP